MKKLVLLALIVVLVGSVILQSRSAEAAPTAPVGKATKACLVRTYTTPMKSGASTIFQYWQKVTVCYNGARVLSYSGVRGYRDYSAYFGFLRYHPFTASGLVVDALLFQSSAVFFDPYDYYVYSYWQPYIFQRVNKLGYYNAISWSFLFN